METGLGHGAPGCPASAERISGAECHFLESSFLRDARSEWALENCRSLWRWGAGVLTCQAARPVVGGFPQAFLITGVISALQIMWFLHLA